MIKDSLYGKYALDRNGTTFIEDDRGFVSYRINGDECYLADMYVDHPFRRSKKFSELLEKLVDVAEEHQCKFISANIYVSDPGAKISLRSALHFGFEPIKAECGIVVLILKLDGGPYG